MSLTSSSESDKEVCFMKNIQFRLLIFNRQPKNSVYLIGSCNELGQWEPCRAIPLSLETINDDRSELWTCQIRIPTMHTVSYRYFTGGPKFNGDNDVMRGLIVSEWEANIKPSEIVFSDDVLANDVIVTSIFGADNILCSGWLMEQTEIRLRLYGPCVNWTGYAGHDPVYVKCVPVFVSAATAEPCDTSLCLPTFLSVQDINSSEDALSIAEPSSAFLSNGYVVFSLQVFDLSQLSFRFDFFATKLVSEKDKGVLIGSAFLEPLKDTNSICTISLLGPQYQHLGRLTVDCLVIKPMSSALCDMSISYARYYRSDRSTLNIGHRGLGSSFRTKQPATQLENTISSFIEAGKHGADYIEFDVHLSKDNIPVIYHDFTTCLVVDKRLGNESDLIEVPVKDLTLQQLQTLKVEHVCFKNLPHHFRSLGSDISDPHRRPFPTLKDVFKTVDVNIGFNVEIKYPIKTESGTLEDGLTTYTDRNTYADRILEEVMQHAGQRRIVLSCFDPDMCTMLSLKQKRYPVMFLTCGEIEYDDKFVDPRTLSVSAAYNFAHSEHLLGVCSCTNPLLQDLSLITKAKQYNLVLWCWGGINTDSEIRQMLKAHHINGIIFDRIDELLPEQDNIFANEEKKL